MKYALTILLASAFLGPAAHALEKGPDTFLEKGPDTF